jgi:uncharacterized protein YeaO (DUF488 family)
VKLKLKRMYEAPSEEDGFRILVDRLWPRGLSKEKAKIDLWLKEVAPSDALRKRFCHDPGKWAEFKIRYGKELAGRKDLVEVILQKLKTGKVTLVFGARDEQHNNAAALKEYLEAMKQPPA